MLAPHSPRIERELSSLGAFAELLEDGAVTPGVLSIDVFDTVITRACGQPSDLFLWLGRLLRRTGVIDCDAVTFAKARSRAELAVWQRDGHLDSRANLDDFYSETVERLGLDASLVPLLRDAELELEAAISRPIPAFKRVLTTYPQPRRLVFTSDTYFEREFVEKLLGDAGSFRADAELIVSSSTDTSKATGGLFAQILPSDRAHEIVHVGDHPHSDLDVPRSLGIDARWVREGRLNRYEQRLASDAVATSGLSSAFAGASRLARMATEASSSREEAVREVTAGVAAPTLVGYVLWILQRAQQLSLSRLVFLARDGQVMAEIARALIARLDIPIEVRYLMVSRQSTNLAATFDLSEEETGWVFRDLSEMSLADAVNRFGLRWEEVAASFAQAGLEDASCSAEEFGPVLRALLAEGPVRELILERSRMRREVVIEFFRQEGLLDGVRCGVIDFGGMGSQVRAVHALFEKSESPAPRIFMFGLDEPEQAGLTRPPSEPAWLRDTECYLYDHRRRRGIRRARGFGTCVQMFCAADHGTVEGYRRAGDALLPVLSMDRDERLLAWGLPTLRSTIANFVDLLLLDDDLLDPYADVREVCCAVVDMFWSSPDKQEAAAWGAFPLEGAQAADSVGEPLAHRYTWRRVGAEMARGQFPNLGWLHWYEGSLALSSPALRAVLTSAERAYRRAESSNGRSLSLAAAAIRKAAGR